MAMRLVGPFFSQGGQTMCVLYGCIFEFNFVQCNEMLVIKFDENLDRYNVLFSAHVWRVSTRISCNYGQSDRGGQYNAAAPTVLWLWLWPAEFAGNSGPKIYRSELWCVASTTDQFLVLCACVTMRRPDTPNLQQNERENELFSGKK